MATYRQYEVSYEPGGRRWVVWFKNAPSLPPHRLVTTTSGDRLVIVRGYRKVYAERQSAHPVYEVAA